MWEAQIDIKKHSKTFFFTNKRGGGRLATGGYLPHLEVGG